MEEAPAFPHGDQVLVQRHHNAVRVERKVERKVERTVLDPPVDPDGRIGRYTPPSRSRSVAVSPVRLLLHEHVRAKAAVPSACRRWNLHKSWTGF
jgi:hypothetical protein